MMKILLQHNSNEVPFKVSLLATCCFTDIHKEIPCFTLKLWKCKFPYSLETYSFKWRMKNSSLSYFGTWLLLWKLIMKTTISWTPWLLLSTTYSLFQMSLIQSSDSSLLSLSLKVCTFYDANFSIIFSNKRNTFQHN